MKTTRNLQFGDPWWRSFSLGNNDRWLTAYDLLVVGLFGVACAFVLGGLVTVLVL